MSQELITIDQEIRQGKPFQNCYHKASVNIIFTGKWLFNLHNQVFQDFDLTVQQYNVLRILNGKYPESVSLKYIKKRMLDKMSDASRIIDVMHKKDLLTREVNPNDRRKLELGISDKGLVLVKEIEKEHPRIFSFLSKLSEKEAIQLNHLLDKARF